MTAASTLRCFALLTIAYGTAAALAQTASPATSAKKRSLHPTAAGAPALSAAALLPPASVEQLAAAARAFFGHYACEFDQSVTVATNKLHEGYVDVSFGKALWTMKPVLSDTGALRLEDVKGRMLLLQIANKSMLMDAVAGRRTVDNCVHEKQRNVAQPSLSQSLGIDPALAAAAAAAATTTALRSPTPATPATSTLTAALDLEAPGP
ncbi:MAG: hypothetical protein AMXMBFR78_37820 [Rubrivivax sp.]|jgi:hypothetical protein